MLGVTDVKGIDDGRSSAREAVEGVILNGKTLRALRRCAERTCEWSDA